MEAEKKKQRPPLPRWFHIVTCAGLGVMLPIGCFATAFGDGIGDGWQAGSSEIAAILMSWRGAWPFYPLLAFSMTALMMDVLAGKTAGQRLTVIRVGLTSGVVLAIQYCIVVGVRLGDALPGIVVINVVTAAVVLIYTWVLWLIPSPRARTAVFTITVVAAAVAALLDTETGKAIMFAGLAGAPTLTFLVFIGRCLGAWRRREGARRDGVAWALFLGWPAAYLLAWRVAVRQTMLHYDSLPRESPDCYVATAAAHGHPRIVGSSACGDARVPVNRQLRVLKAAELAWRTVAPTSHAGYRRAYDRVGPPLARQLRSPLVADCAYLSLKPAEVIAEALLSCLLPDWRRQVDCIYQPDR